MFHALYRTDRSSVGASARVDSDAFFFKVKRVVFGASFRLGFTKFCNLFVEYVKKDDV